MQTVFFCCCFFFSLLFLLQPIQRYSKVVENVCPDWWLTGGRAGWCAAVSCCSSCRAACNHCCWCCCISSDSSINKTSKESKTDRVERWRKRRNVFTRYCQYTLDSILEIQLDNKTYFLSANNKMFWHVAQFEQTNTYKMRENTKILQVQSNTNIKMDFLSIFPVSYETNRCEILKLLVFSELFFFFRRLYSAMIVK